MTINKYGLSSYIPENVKRKIRQKSGFGCVYCGFAIVDYHHVDPPFKDAKTHDPDKITLLCGNCHNKVTRGSMSNQTIKRMMLNPKCLQDGFTREFFDVDVHRPTIKINGSVFTKVNHIIQVYGCSILSIHPPEQIGAPFTLSGVFFDEDEKKSFIIEKNEWKAYTSNSDIIIKGKNLYVKNGKKENILHIRLNPPNELSIEKMYLQYKGATIKIQDEAVFLTNGKTESWILNTQIFECNIGIEIDEIGVALGVGRYVPDFAFSTKYENIIKNPNKKEQKEHYNKGDKLKHIFSAEEVTFISDRTIAGENYFELYTSSKGRITDYSALYSEENDTIYLLVQEMKKDMCENQHNGMGIGYNKQSQEIEKFVFFKGTTEGIQKKVNALDMSYPNLTFMVFVNAPE